MKTVLPERARPVTPSPDSRLYELGRGFPGAAQKIACRLDHARRRLARLAQGLLRWLHQVTHLAAGLADIVARRHRQIGSLFLGLAQGFLRLIFEIGYFQERRPEQLRMLRLGWAP